MLYNILMYTSLRPRILCLSRVRQSRPRHPVGVLQAFRRTLIRYDVAEVIERGGLIAGLEDTMMPGDKHREMQR